jgi:hypothetical protein
MPLFNDNQQIAANNPQLQQTLTNERTNKNLAQLAENNNTTENFTSNYNTNTIIQTKNTI